jgi:hypothetical protein
VEVEGIVEGLLALLRGTTNGQGQVHMEPSLVITGFRSDALCWTSARPSSIWKFPNFVIRIVRL